MQTIDFGKKLKHLYTAKRRIQEVEAGASTFFAVEGRGTPGGDAFQQAIGQLFAAAYTTKFTLKYDGVVDFKIPRLECLYLSAPDKTAIDQWRWRFLLRVPEAVTAGHLAKTRKTLKERKGLDTRAVKRIRWKEGRAIQVLHVGPYDQVGTIYCQMEAYAKENQWRLLGPAHEIYLNDPRRVAPEKLKTIVRMPVRKA
ncbi:MAG TPA: GyrI-like domain-containing protein [Phycisphaerae bacterium]|nr:GyrI-like domain-containing protein [Phycisphaerae bacterium]HRY66512.1 GyrI-like domain-containing protein [Phycisphaerae bacterium]HSA28624.1 GyrI-like domain-containing protein [Phycisphaerae bacterium]